MSGFAKKLWGLIGGNLTWDVLKEVGRLMLPFLIAQGLGEWIKVDSVGVLFLVAIVVAAVVAFLPLGRSAAPIVVTRPPSPKQADAISGRLAERPGYSIEIVLLVVNDDTERCASELAHAFRKADWNIGNGIKRRLPSSSEVNLGQGSRCELRTRETLRSKRDLLLTPSNMRALI